MMKHILPLLAKGASCLIQSTVEATYKGRLYKGQLLIRDSLKSTDFSYLSCTNFCPL